MPMGRVGQKKEIGVANQLPQDQRSDKWAFLEEHNNHIHLSHYTNVDLWIPMHLVAASSENDIGRKHGILS